MKPSFSEGQSQFQHLNGQTTCSLSLLTEGLTIVPNHTLIGGYFSPSLREVIPLIYGRGFIVVEIPI